MSLIEALKVAYCYMPESEDLNAEQYGENTEMVKKEVEMVRAALIAEGVDPDKVYSELNPPLNSQVSPSTKALIDMVKSKS